MSTFSFFLDVQQFVLNALLTIRVFMEIVQLRKQKPPTPTGQRFPMILTQTNKT
jgi:hypothetical protein